MPCPIQPMEPDSGNASASAAAMASPVAATPVICIHEDIAKVWIMENSDARWMTSVAKSTICTSRTSSMNYL
eukprot:8149418-Prorocentrum_lima.AAC.1